MDLLKGYSDKDVYDSDDVPLSSLSSRAPPTTGNGKGRATIKYDNGCVYKGDAIDGKACGKCKFTYANGSVYEGEWADDAPNGRGKMKYADGDANARVVYEGEWIRGGRHGQGKCTYVDGSVYEGEWKEDWRSGKGEFKSTNGEEYDGEWKAGKRSGRGKLTLASGSVYEGEFIKGMRHGKGKCTYVDGKIYEGQWREGKRHGRGKCTFPNGDRYEGEYKQEYSNGELLSSKRVAILIHGPSSQRHRTNEAVGVVVLNDEEMRCGICGEDYSFDTDSDDEDAEKHLPVISSCDHTCCHGCVLKWQISRAEANNGRVAKRVPCMLCKKSSAICPSEPKYNRMLIDFLGRCSR
ncbi:hypothetical protein ACHAXT_005708 [Thalassiosira profunda]